jgi:hypothetical protein
MTKESIKPAKYASRIALHDHVEPITMSEAIKRVARHEHIAVPISRVTSKSIKSLSDMGFHVLGKEDINKELARTKELYGMTPEEFYQAWKNDEIHGFHATKLGCLYEFYRDEYE